MAGHSGFIIAGNNVNGTKGISKTTLTGPAVGYRSAAGICVAAVDIPIQSCDPRRRRLLL